MPQRLPLLVFSDLDGTLLDHHDYSWELARPGLQRLHDLGAGLVLASSKTAAEIEGYRQSMGFPHMPAIVENGAGILWPDEAETSGSGEYESIRGILEQLPPGFVGFADMSLGELSDRTGLDLDAAAKAQLRQFSEPGLWTGSPEGLERFLDAAAQHGLHARQGGRFLTLSMGKTKAVAMATVINRLTPEQTIALGDAPNDLEMILAADTGVIVANRLGAPFPELTPEEEGQVIRTTLEGPEGWAEAVLTLTAAP
ncbi:mannosyl-3-phosphoglycerate phosphatase-related protein [Pelagimonas sp. KU-00592-HH]